MEAYSERIKEKMAVMEPVKIPPHVHEDCILGDFSDETQAFIDDFQRVIDDPDLPHAVDDLREQQEEGDPYVNMRLSMKRTSDGQVIGAKVTERATDDDGKPRGTANNNPVLDLRQYVINYIDGTSEVVTANVIAENILSQVDDHGYGRRQLEEIIDYRTTDQAVPKHKGWLTTPTNQKRRK